MPADLDDIYARGGRPLLNLLEYCVVSIQLDPLFVFLVGEFRTRPTSSSAVALHDVFLSATAPVRHHGGSAIPRNDLRLDAEMKRFRQSLLAFEQMQRDDPQAAVPPLIPPTYLFDGAVAATRRDCGGAFQKVAREFDPSRPAVEQLPGARLNAGQMAFVERQWRPSIRPHLVAAGFWRVAAIR